MAEEKNSRDRNLTPSTSTEASLEAVSDSGFALKSMASGLYGNLAVWLPLALIAVFSVYDQIWTAIPLMERFAFLPWLLFLYTYGVCAIYERAQYLEKKNRKIRRRNYKGTLYWGLILVVVHFAYLGPVINPNLSTNPFFLQLLQLNDAVGQLNSWIASGPLGNFAFFTPWLGLAIAFYGTLKAAAGRIYLNGFWGVHVYEYDKEIHHIVRHGPYKSVRHPIYQGQFLLVLGTALASGSVLFYVFALFTWVMNHLRALAEEQELSELFGEEFEVYKKDVSPRYFGAFF